MNELLESLLSELKSDSIPNEKDFLVFNGIDQPGKEYLRDAFLGKSQNEIYEMLRSGKLGNGSTYMEELPCAEITGLRYYLHPFLRYFMDQVQSNDRALNEEFPFFLFFELGNILERKGNKVFTNSQLTILAPLIDLLIGQCRKIQDGNWSEDGERHLTRVKELLSRA